MSDTAGPEAVALSVVCVYNDAEVRARCLDRALAAYRGTVRLDYVPVDNTAHAYATAGAALNHGVRLARHPVVVLVHQDVHLHSVDRLAAAAAHLADPHWGLLGANGFTRDGVSTGRLRDRVLLIGAPAPTPVEVDSLDEVLVIARRDDLLEHPLSEDPDLAWHAYAVEHGLRMRSLGRKVGAVDCAITHNSLTVNLARLDEAHARVAQLHPGLTPVRTTCGTVGGPAHGWRDAAWVREHGWRLRWLRGSARAAALRRAAPGAAHVVLADLDHEVDLLGPEEGPLTVLNLDRPGGFAVHVADEPVRLLRRDRPLTMQAFESCEELGEALEAVPASEDVVATGLRTGDVARLAARLEPGTWLAGLQWDEAWLVRGPGAVHPPARWLRPPAAPWGRTGRRVAGVS